MIQIHELVLKFAAGVLVVVFMLVVAAANTWGNHRNRVA
jgi:hypothetical protein